MSEPVPVHWAITFLFAGAASAEVNIFARVFPAGVVDMVLLGCFWVCGGLSCNKVHAGPAGYFCAAIFQLGLQLIAEFGSLAQNDDVCVQRG